MAQEKRQQQQQNDFMSSSSICSVCNNPLLESFICSTCDGNSIQPESVLLYDENQQKEQLDESNKITVVTADIHNISRLGIAIFHKKLFCLLPWFCIFLQIFIRKKNCQKKLLFVFIGLFTKISFCEEKWVS